MQKRKYLNIAYNQEEKPKSKYPYLLMRHILHNLLDKKEGTVVDVGCGIGHQMEAIHQLGFKVVGLDRERACDTKFEFKQCDITNSFFPISDNFADIVFCKSVIEHIYFFQMDHLFSEMKRILKPGGILIISTPDWKYNVKEFYTEYTHCTPFTSRSIEHCLKIYGLEEVTVYSLIPLPITWNSNVFRLLSNITLFLNLPRRWGKWCRWSQERQLLAYGKISK